ALVIWWIRRSLPESPRWLVQHGRTAEAERIVADLEERIRADTGKDLPPPQLVAGETEHKAGAWIEMWSPVYRGRTIMLVIFNLFQTIGYYGFSSWVATLLFSQGIEVTKSLAYTFIIAFAAPVGLVYWWSRFSAIFSGFIIAFFLSRYGTIGVFGFIASAMVVVFVVVGFFGPPVTRRRL